MDREKMIELQLAEYQLQQLQQQIQTMEQQIEEVNSVQVNLREFGKLKAGDELLVPVANGMFAKAELKDNKKISLNVGSDVIVEKTVDQSIKLLDKHVEEIMRVHNEAVIQFQSVAEKVQTMQEGVEG